MEIGAQLYTVRDFTQTVQDIALTFEKLAKIGYKTVQVSAIGAIEPKALKEIADKNDIKIVITHSNPDRLLNDIDNIIAEHKIINCNNVGIGSMPSRYHGSLAAARAFISDYSLTAQKLNEAGMKFQYHNHGFEFQRFGSDTIFDVLVNETSPELWGFILDTYWVQFGGKNPVQQIIDLKGRINVCHFKDMKLKEHEHLMAAVMEGNLDFPQIIDACNKTGVEYAMVEQDNCNGEFPFEMLDISFKNLKKLGL